MKTKALISACLGSVLLLADAGRTAPQEPDKDKMEDSRASQRWKAEDVVFTESASQFRISPAGRWAVWVKNVADKEKDARVTNLFLSSLAEKKEIQLTRGTETHSQPRWSPNGQLVAFLSTRPVPQAKPETAKPQLWLINPFGGEPWHLTESERGIKTFRWLDNENIIFSAEEDPTLYEREIKRKKDQTRVIDDVVHTPPVRLFKIGIKDKKVLRLTENNDFIEHWDLSPDGRRAAAIHEQYLSYEWDHRIPPKVLLHDFATSRSEQIFPDPRTRPTHLRWAADGSGVYALVPHTTHPTYFTATIGLVYFHNLMTRKSMPVDLGWENGLGNDVEHAANFQITRDGFLALLAEGARFRPARYTRAGESWTRAFLEGEHARNIFAWAANEAGQIAYEYSTASRPQQWYAAQLEGNRISSPVQITDLNPQLKNKVFAKTEVIRWKGAQEEEVEGILYYPHDYELGKRYPLIVAPHGGPASADMDAWDDSWGYAANLFNQRGAFFFKPNYHGSGNYGLKWVESICCGKYYDLEIPDIEKGVDFLIAAGKVDPERIGALGWSNGSILSIGLLVTNPDRYKAAAVGAGNVEYLSDWANSYFGHSFDSYYFGKSLLEDPEVYIRKSPLFRKDRVKTPTLIFFGTEDRTVHPSQGWTHYRALYYLGKVPVRFVLFPGEDHVPQKLTHRLRKVTEELAWFDRYLFKTEKAANEALKEDSPLALTLRSRSISKSGALYGVAHKMAAARGSVLVPEAVRRGELEIGRFEVTRAQYAAFDRSYKFEPGTENYPANGVSFDQAKAYSAWLSKLTGQPWRLPNEDEVASLYEKREAENTLDYWAGYAVNPDDAARLEKQIRELQGAAPLLKPVGSFRGAGMEEEELLFDLGGNVAEWVIARDASGRALGRSADRPADGKTASPAAAPEYTGFRVVRGEPKKNR